MVSQMSAQPPIGQEEDHGLRHLKLKPGRPGRKPIQPPVARPTSRHSAYAGGRAPGGAWLTTRGHARLPRKMVALVGCVFDTAPRYLLIGRQADPF